MQDNLQLFRFCRVAFGVISSPFLLGVTLKHHLEEIGTPMALLIANNLYVDKLVVGVETLEEAVSVFKEGKATFNQCS